MRRLALACALVAPTLALAQAWQKLPDTPGFSIFLDQRQLRLSATPPSGWVMVNYAAPRDGAQSFRMLAEFDCARYLVRTIEATQHSGLNATGTVVSTVGATTWMPAPPGEFLDAVLRGICPKVKTL